MNLTIDAGNTSIKVLVLRGDNPVYRHACKSLSTRYLQSLQRSFTIEEGMISSVIHLSPAVKKHLKSMGVRELTERTKIPVKNLYKTPSTLGKDRLANVIAASFLFPGKNILVVDCGTCIKYDLLQNGKIYRGGSISPGLEMRFNALHRFTGKLPRVESRNPNKLIGNTTVTAIQTGVFNGIIGEINEVISRYRKQYPGLKVIITGGDAHRFVGQLNLSIFAASDLVNLGLNEIIKYGQKF
ncbi:MAG: type III pantothenate kinase [Bacteroidetes bacterium]|nr:type III pantothenate kinase [Bacteroidota bacterium]